MCGRYTLKTPAHEIAAAMGLTEVPELDPHYNIAPTQAVALVRSTQEQPDRHLAWVRWGFVPSWSKEGPTGAPLINARVETADQKPTFRKAFASRRGLMPADGFYEWRRSTDKQPFVFQLPNDEVYGFAALWERWHGPNGEVVDSCAMLTTDANETMAPIHHRMPIILPKDCYDAWLDPKEQDPKHVHAILEYSLCDRLVAKAVSTRINKVSNDDASLLEAVAVTATAEPKELRLFD